MQLSTLSLMNLTTPQPQLQVDLVFPPAAAFTKPSIYSCLSIFDCPDHIAFTPGHPALLWSPILGQKSIHWDQVFALVQQPGLLWDCWKPSKSLDQFDLEELWTCCNLGELVFNADGVQTGIKPPLQLVEQYFQSKWQGHSAGIGSI